jgi:hypothetical protein
MFDFAPPSFLLPFDTTFTDINPEYLQRLPLDWGWWRGCATGSSWTMSKTVA